MKPKLLLVEQYSLLSYLLKFLLANHESLATATIETTTFEAAAQAARVQRPDVIIFELDSFDKTGLSILQKFNRLSQKPKIIVRSRAYETSLVKQALLVGIDGYIPKCLPLNELVAAIKNVLDNKPYIASPIAEKLAWEVVAKNGAGVGVFDELSTKEFQVMLMISHGKSAKEIADVMCISDKTVANYHVRILKKLGLSSDTKLIQILHQHHLLDFIV